MIAYLQGLVQMLAPTEAIINVNGVGYSVFITIATFEKLADEKNAELFIHTAVREDAIQLYGFSTIEEKKMFELLISVNNVGPKSAMGILSGIRSDDLRTAIGAGDLSRLVAIPGIGRKTAERILLELKDKVEHIGESPAGGYTVRSEAMAALSALGYNPRLAEKAIRDVLDTAPDLPIEEVIKQALKKLAI